MKSSYVIAPAQPRSSEKLTLSLILLLSGLVDITDENGTLKCIHERPPDQFASEYLQGRGTYVLLKVSSKFSFYIYVFSTINHELQLLIRTNLPR